MKEFLDKIIATIKEAWDCIKLYFKFEDEVPRNIHTPSVDELETTNFLKDSPNSEDEDEDEAPEFDFKDPKYGYMFFNCNENKDHTSMNPLHNPRVFENTPDGRAALWTKICQEIMFSRVKASIEYSTLEKIIKYGRPEDASQYLTYANIIEVVINY